MKWVIAIKSLTKEDISYIKENRYDKENILLEIALQLERIADVLEKGYIGVKM